MRFEAIFVSFLASAAMASPQGAQRVRRGGGGGGGGSTVTVTSTVTETTTTTSTVTAEPTCPSSGGGGDDDGSTYAPCAGLLYGNAECCDVDVLGVADLNCGSPAVTPTSADDFVSICAAAGQKARCCVLPVLGQAVLCETPVGVTA